MPGEVGRYAGADVPVQPRCERPAHWLTGILAHRPHWRTASPEPDLDVPCPLVYTTALMDWPRLTEAQRFGIRFFVLLIGFSIFAWAVNLPNHLALPQRWLASGATALANLVGSPSSATRSQISTGGLVIDINYECTGVYVLLILFTFLIAYPASWRSRLAGAAVGLVALSIVNVLRISFLVRVAELQPALFGYMHEYVWQGLFLILVIAYAMTWVEHVQ
jgi:exosortase/archaeosortase family protein